MTPQKMRHLAGNTGKEGSNPGERLTFPRGTRKCESLGFTALNLPIPLWLLKKMRHPASELGREGSEPGRDTHFLEYSEMSI